MSYVAQSRRPNPAAVLGAFGIPAAFGVLLVTGLAVTGVIKNEIPNPKGVLVTPKKPTPTPPPPDVVEIPKPTQPSSSTITAPTSPIDLTETTAPPDRPLPPTPPLPPGPTPGVGDGLGTGAGPIPTPTPPTPTPNVIDPIAAQPRGNPGTWITTRDYRSSWIRRNMTGQATFQLQISASGRVTGCTIVGSTGHAALDQATCRLISKRARFTPARDNKGAVTAGTFRSSVNWRIP